MNEIFKILEGNARASYDEIAAMTDLCLHDSRACMLERCTSTIGSLVSTKASLSDKP